MAKDPPPSDAVSPSPADCLWTDLHYRAIGGDPAALEAIADQALSVLCRQLRCAFPRVDDEILHDAVTDACIDYARRPEGLDPASGGPLDRFLYRAAWRNVADSLKSGRRRRNREVQYAKEVRYANEVIRRSPSRAMDQRSVGIEADMIQRILECALDDAERAALARWLGGEWRTGPLAQALCVGLLPVTDQRLEVKRFKDRLLKRIARLPK